MHMRVHRQSRGARRRCDRRSARAWRTGRAGVPPAIAAAAVSRPTRGGRLLLAATIAFCGAVALVGLPVAAAAEECPNAAFRTGPGSHLPDCRAYELVSPAYKATGAIEGFRMGSSGTSGVLQLFAAVDGAESFNGIIFPGPYSVNRTASGWVSVNDEPPAAEYRPFLYGEAEAYQGESLDGQTTVFAERKTGQAENRVDFFERQPDRAIVDVGPGLPPSAPDGEPLTIGREHDLSVVGVSADGSRLLFELDHEFWPGDGTEAGPNDMHSLYEYLGTGNSAPLLVGVDSEGRQIGDCGTVLGAGTPYGSAGNGLIDSSHNAISMDGETVFFTAYPDDYEGDGCTAAVAPPVAELFARVENGLPGAHTVAISEPSEEGCAACYTHGVLNSAGELADAVFVGASADGSKVFFSTTQPLLGGDTSRNLYEYDFDAPPGERLIRVTAGDATVSSPAAKLLASEPDSEADESAMPVVSEDGSHVYFLAHGVLTDTPNAEGETAVAGALNLYVFAREAGDPAGRVAFVARLAPSDLSHAGAGLAPGGFNGLGNATPDGRFFVFTSERDLTPDDTSSEARQAFEYDAQSGALVRVSIGEHGFNHDGNAEGAAADANIAAPSFAGLYTADEYSSRLSVSANGSYVFFESPVALTPQALSEVKGAEGTVENVYEYHDGQVSLISDGQDATGRVQLLTTDESGEDVFFTTADQLTGEDSDTNLDVYDARIDGGFPPPAAPAPCDGEACQGELSAAPTLLSPGSEFQQGGNPPLAAPPATTKSKQAKAKRRRTKAKRAHSKDRKPNKKAKPARKLARGRDARRRGRGGRA